MRIPALLLLLACSPETDPTAPATPPGLRERSPGSASPGPSAATATDPGTRVARQRVYVPAYSNVFSGEGQPLLLAITLSVRNTSDTTPITLRELHYRDANGAIVKEHDQGPRLIPPLGSAEFFVPERDTSGGSGASFLLIWDAEQPVTAPVIQAIHLSTKSQLGVSLVTEGRVLESWSAAP